MEGGKITNCIRYNASYGCNLSPTFVKKFWRIEFSPQKSQLYHFWCRIACRFQKCYQKYPNSRLNGSKLTKYLKKWPKIAIFRWEKFLNFVFKIAYFLEKFSYDPNFCFKWKIQPRALIWYYRSPNKYIIWLDIRTWVLRRKVGKFLRFWKKSDFF